MVLVFPYYEMVRRERWLVSVMDYLLSLRKCTPVN